MDTAKSKSKKPELAVVLLTYQRPERFARTIEMLQAQTKQGFLLYVHNNNPEITGIVDEALSKSKLDYQVNHAEKNEGSWAYVEAGKKLHKAGTKRIVIIGDDVVFGSEFIENIAAEYQDKAIVGNYAWRIRPGGGYWKRDRVRPDGLPPHYIGSAGAIYDASIFALSAIDKCPKKYRAVEDLWLSYLASTTDGWQLVATSVQVGVVVDGKDQYQKIISLKSDFLNYLRGKGWDV